MKKIFIGTGIFLTLLLGLGIYGNYKLDRIIDTMVQSGLVESIASPSAATDAGKGNTDTNNEPDAVLPDASTSAPEDSSGNSVPDFVTDNLSGSPSLSPEQTVIASGVERHLGRTVERRDLLTAGSIIINRFSWSEINYLYTTGSRGLQSKEETRQVRALLLSRLSSGDIATLTALGNKYGLSLKILDASYPIK